MKGIQRKSSTVEIVLKAIFKIADENKRTSINWRTLLMTTAMWKLKMETASTMTVYISVFDAGMGEICVFVLFSKNLKFSNS